MGLFKKFFCAAQVAADDEGEKKENRKFQTLRDDGVRAMRMGETKFATQCFEEARNKRQRHPNYRFFGRSPSSHAELHRSIALTYNSCGGTAR